MGQNFSQVYGRFERIAILVALLGSCGGSQPNKGRADVAVPPDSHNDTPSNDDASLATDVVPDGAGEVAEAAIDGRADIAPGNCSLDQCTPECLDGMACVTACGGPVTWCGCCPCAAGSIRSNTCF